MKLSRSAWPRWARTLSSPWLLSPLLVMALLVAVFIGYGAWTRSRPTHYSRGGAFQAVNGLGAMPVASATARPPAGGLPGGGKGAAGAAGAPQPSSSAAAGASPSGSSGIGTTRSNGSRSAAARTGRMVTQPAIGTYELSVSGSEHVKFGPFSACTNTFPASSALVVSHAAGEPGSSYDFDQSFYADSPNRHDERHIYRYAANSVALTFEEATVTCSGIKQSTTVNYRPTQTRVLLPLTIGATWHTTGGDSGRTEAVSAKIIGTDRLTLGRTSYLVYVIDSHVTMSGSESGTRDQRWWWSPTLGIQLKWSEALSGSRSGATYSADYTCTVTSLP